jgi:hypothetical protein
MSTRRIALTVFVLAVGIIAMGSAHAQDRPAIAVSNNYQAYAAAIDSINDGKARQCSSKTDALKAMAAKCASDICLALFADKVERACGQQGGQEQVAVTAPPVEKTWFQEAKETVIDVARVALPFVDRVMTSRDNRAIRESNERQTVALYGTFRDLNGQTVAGMTTLGTAGINGVRDTATAGFGALERTAAAAFKNPTYNINVNGNDNNLFGSASTRTYTNNCTSGQAGSSSGTTGSPAGGPSGQVPCTISK